MYVYSFTQAALRDLEQIANHITYELMAPESAKALLLSMQEAVRNACAFPLSLPPVTDASLHRKGYRKIIVKSYTIFVIPDEDAKVLNVMRILYYRQDHRTQLL